MTEKKIDRDLAAGEFVDAAVLTADTKVYKPTSRAPVMNCDRIARWYHAAELLAFGGALQACRTMYVSEVSDCRRALLCGDGDGRFLAKLLRSNSKVRVDVVDLSERMTALAERRVDAL